MATNDPGDWVDAPRIAAPRAQPDDWVDVGSNQQQEVSGLESAARGAAQGLSFGWSDEITGALGSIIGDETYQQIRDRERAANDAARAQHPWIYGGTELGAGILSPLSKVGAIGKAAGVGGAALKALANPVVQGAVIGGANALGYSNQDLRPTAITPESAGNAAAETVLGAGIGGAVTHAAGKLFGGAEQRAVKRRMGDLTVGATARMRDEMVGEAGRNIPNVQKVLKEIGTEANAALRARDPKRALAAFQEAEKIAGENIGAFWDKVGAMGERAKIDPAVVAMAIDEVAEKTMGDAALKGVRDSVRNMAAEYLAENPNRVDARSVRDFMSSLQGAFQGNPAFPDKVGTAFGKKMAGAVGDVIDDHLSKLGGQKLVAEYKGINQTYSTLKNMVEPLTYKATRESTESTRLTDVMADTAAKSATSEVVASGDAKQIMGRMAAKLYESSVGPVSRRLDESLAYLVKKASEPGATLAKVTLAAAQMGFSAQVAAAAFKTGQRTIFGD